jgi:hypothetical protein
MKLYDKRIAFLISDQHFIPHGGIGSFAKGFTEMCGRIGWKVDILLDKKPEDKVREKFTKLIESLGGRVVYTKTSISYGKHNAIFQKGDSINFERIINFRNCIMDAMETNLYDLILCNTQEAMTAAYSLKLNEDIPVMFYTHLHSMIFREEQNFSDVFLDCYHNLYNKHMELHDVYIGTQSQKNIDELTKYGATNCVLLRMPMSERGLLERYTGPRKGVLFIGRWEEGKNPEAYIRVMKECGLPCKVMTSDTAVEKFKEAFQKANITDYEIKSGITGQEKIDFIRSSSMFFMPSLRENYPFAFLECLGHMPCVVLDTQDWSDNFDSQYYHKVNIKGASNLIKTIYGSDQVISALPYVKNLDSLVEHGWIDFVNSAPYRKSKADTAAINKEPTPINYHKFIKILGKKLLGRKQLARIDFESVLTNRHKFIVKYTDNNTYLIKNANEVIPDDSVLNESVEVEAIDLGENPADIFKRMLR